MAGAGGIDSPGAADDGVPQALQLLRERGLLLIVVTNQPDVARGTQTSAMIEQLNAESQKVGRDRCVIRQWWRVLFGVHHFHRGTSERQTTSQRLVQHHSNAVPIASR